jgi:hypothetical protein
LRSAQEPHLYQKTGSCAVYYIIAFGPFFGDSDNRKFAAGVTTRHIRNNALRRTKGGLKQVPKTQQTADLPVAIRHFS